jgi:hypothetical protein
VVVGDLARWLRDEEAAGSNPATPTTKPQVMRHRVTCDLCFTSSNVRLWEPGGSEILERGAHLYRRGIGGKRCPLT